jgi:hypothetical protein
MRAIVELHDGTTAHGNLLHEDGRGLRLDEVEIVQRGWHKTYEDDPTLVIPYTSIRFYFIVTEET